jgi:hypothetical protein
MAANRDKQRGYQNTDPCEAGFDITPHDTNELTNTTRMLRVNGTAGTVKVDMAGTGTLTLDMLKGDVLPICVRKVYNTGTTATGIQGFY